MEIVGIKPSFACNCDKCPQALELSVFLQICARESWIIILLSFSCVHSPESHCELNLLLPPWLRNLEGLFPPPIFQSVKGYSWAGSRTNQDTVFLELVGNKLFLSPHLSWKCIWNWLAGSKFETQEHRHTHAHHNHLKLVFPGGYKAVTFRDLDKFYLLCIQLSEFLINVHHPRHQKASFHQLFFILSVTAVWSYTAGSI